MVRILALVVTVLTGFSALVYEIAWQKYLSALLGSQSEATVAVLAIFLGALSYGYSLFGRLTLRWVDAARRESRVPRLLSTYGFVEMGIGVYALCFPWTFQWIWHGSLLLPITSPALSFIIDVLLSALLIGPPAVLMGATIPLLTQALSRDLEDATRLHALVYATNTVGSTAGALSAGFFLVPWLGLDGSVLAMGGGNIAAGLVLIALGKHQREGEPVGVVPGPSRADVSSESAKEGVAGLRALLLVAMLSGFAAMTLQVIMNRIGALSLGASHFTFSMVVATFVFCIALGSFAVARLAVIPTFVLPASQWILFGYLVALYPFVDDAPYWAHLLRSTFPNEIGDFYRFHFAVFLWILLVFLVPLGIAGATLPLLFHHLRRQFGDLGSIAGRLYSWNTIGSLLGSLLGGYALLFWLDLHQTYRVALIAIITAAALLSARVLQRGARAAVALAVVCTCLLWWLPAWSPKQLSSGLFRTRHAATYTNAGPREFWKRYRSSWPDDYVAYYRDDPSHSIAVNRKPLGGDKVSISIINNGKSDSAIPEDDVTTSFMALIPALLAERRERAFLVGYGTGRTAGQLLELEDLDELVVAEISEAVMEAAPLFDPHNGNALQSPKLRIARSDAYRALLRSDTRYDLIVSAPSNPWVTGVEMLFSLDFVEAAKNRLAPGGVFVQWFHTYEMDERTTELVFETFRTGFSRTAVWYGRGADLLIMGFQDDYEEKLDEIAERFARPDFQKQFGDLGLRSLPQVLAHELLPLDVLPELVLAPRVHTIANPRLSHQAALAFYRGRSAQLPDIANASATTVGRTRSLLRRYGEQSGMTDADRADVINETCRYRLRPCATLFAEWISVDPDSVELARLLSHARNSGDHRELLAPESLDPLLLLFGVEGTSTAKGLTPARIEELERVYQRFYHYGAPFAEDALARLRSGS